MSEAPGNRIHNLWPSLLGQGVLTDLAAHASALLALAERDDLPDNLLDLDLPAVAWLAGAAHAAVTAWMQAAQAVPSTPWTLSARFERLAFCESRPLANEPGAFAAGVMFLHAPGPNELEHIRADCVPSQVSLYDPRPGFNAISLAGDPYFAPTVNVTPEPGAVAVWPAHLRSFFSVHLAREPWVVVRLTVRSGATPPPPPAPAAVPVAMKVSKLFPTKLVQRHFADFPTRTKELKNLINRDERRRSEATVRYQEQDFFARTERPVTWLARHVNETVDGYLLHVGVRYPVTWKVEGWYNVNRRGDHHAPHGHQGAYLSGTYYVDVPTSTGADEASACISFYDPRAAANMCALGVGSDAQPAIRLAPRPGTLLMWPAPLLHYVHPNRTDQERLSISFNIILTKVGQTTL